MQDRIKFTKLTATSGIPGSPRFHRRHPLLDKALKLIIGMALKSSWSHSPQSWLKEAVMSLVTLNDLHEPRVNASVEYITTGRFGRDILNRALLDGEC